MRRDVLAVLALVRLGIPHDEAFDLVLYAIETDPILGVERVFAEIRALCRKHTAAEARELRETCELIVALSDRCAALEAYVRGMERDAVAPLRRHPNIGT